MDSRQGAIREWAKAIRGMALVALRERQTRRQLMFYLTLATMAIVTIGFVFFSGLANAPVLLVAYWSFCLLMVCLMILLAVYDMASVRKEMRGQLKSMRESILGKPPDQT